MIICLKFYWAVDQSRNICKLSLSSVETICLLFQTLLILFFFLDAFCSKVLGWTSSILNTLILIWSRSINNQWKEEGKESEKKKEKQRKKTEQWQRHKNTEAGMRPENICAKNPHCTPPNWWTSEESFIVSLLMLIF